MATFYRKSEIPEHLQQFFQPAEIGLEPTLADYIATMVDVFREVKRVLRDDGTLWLNIGDSYCGSWGNYGGQNRGNGSQRTITNGSKAHQKSYDGLEQWRPATTNQPGLKPKDLMMVPARLAIALQDDGWYLRSDIIWAKPNPMPESVRDRPTSAHEHIFLLTKSARYYYDAEAVKTKTKIEGMTGGPRTNPDRRESRGMEGPRTDKQRGHSRRHDGFNDRWDAMSKDEQQANGANLRNVWEIATQGFAGAHFATFPPEIPRRCIKAGCPEGGIVLDPFGGAGTVGLVADELGRNAILIELNTEYAEMARQRIHGAAPLFAEVMTV